LQAGFEEGVTESSAVVGVVDETTARDSRDVASAEAGVCFGCAEKLGIGTGVSVRVGVGGVGVDVKAEEETAG